MLATDGADAKIISAIEFIAPEVGGFTDSEGKPRPAQQKVNGGPPVLDAAVPLILSADAAAFIAQCRRLRLWTREPQVHSV